MFRGRHMHTIDAKGRVSIPSKFRDVLNGRGQQTLVMTNELEGCLVAFPMNEWFEEEKKIQAYPNHIPEILQYKRFYISGAEECRIDRQGRILLPPSLREHAQLDREALFVGLLEKFEVWSPHLWQKAPENVAEIRRKLYEHSREHPVKREAGSDQLAGGHKL